MRRILLYGLVCVMLLLTACGHADVTEEPSHDHTHDHTHGTTAATTAAATAGLQSGGDVIRFNQPKDRTQVAGSLAAPVTADKETFDAAYDIRWKGMLDDDTCHAEYTLYHYTAEAAQQMGLSGLSYGTVCITKEGQKAMMMWVSDSGYAGSVGFPDDRSTPSKIRGQQVYLVDASQTKTASMYAQFQWGKHFITCEMYGCEQVELVNFVRSILGNTPR